MTTDILKVRLLETFPGHCAPARGKVRMDGAWAWGQQWILAGRNIAAGTGKIHRVNGANETTLQVAAIGSRKLPPQSCYRRIF